MWSRQDFWLSTQSSGQGLAQKGKVTADPVENQEGQADAHNFWNSHCVHKIQMVGGLRACRKSCHPLPHKGLPGQSSRPVRSSRNGTQSTRVVFSSLVATCVKSEKKQGKCILISALYFTNTAYLTQYVQKVIVSTCNQYKNYWKDILCSFFFSHYVFENPEFILHLLHFISFLTSHVSSA